MTEKISTASKTYIRMPIDASGLDPTSDLLECGLTPDRTPPTTWSAGIWKTINGEYWAELLVGPGSTYGAVTAGRYRLAARVTDNPERPVLFSTNLLVFTDR